MDFYLPYDFPSLSPKLQLSDQLLAIGSCFSDHIALRLRKNKVSCTPHPFGTLYHPLSIAKALTTKREVHPSQDITCHDGLYFHWDAHSRLWATDKQTLISKYQQHIDEVRQKIKDVQWVIITLGSAYLYTLTPDERPVANCHKQSQNSFRKSLSSVKDMRTGLLQMQQSLWESNPKLRFIYTVSPVRHIKDGFTENHISKSRLLEVATELSTDSKVGYFPSYEIIIDQLRDYRFYKQDGIHPSETAIDFVWQKLAEKWFSEELNYFFQQWQPIKKGLEHKPLYPNSAAHLKFKASMLKKLENLSHQVDVSEEIAFFKS